MAGLAGYAIYEYMGVLTFHSGERHTSAVLALAFLFGCLGQRLLARIANGHYSSRDFSADSLRQALELYVLHFPVYRTYLTTSAPTANDRKLIEDTIARAHSFAEETLGKICIDSQDRAGFVVNALLIPYLLSAIRMYESGFASKEDIDNGMVLGCAHPMGPLALADLIGLDTLQAVAESLYEEFRDPAAVAPAVLNRMVEAGLLGRKSGRGFYDYSS